MEKKTLRKRMIIKIEINVIKTTKNFSCFFSTIIKDGRNYFSFEEREIPEEAHMTDRCRHVFFVYYYDNIHYLLNNTRCILSQ